MRLFARTDYPASIVSITDPVGSRLFAGLGYARLPARAIDEDPPPVVARPVVTGDRLRLHVGDGVGRVDCDVMVSPTLETRGAAVPMRVYPPGGLLGVMSRGLLDDVVPAIASLTSMGATTLVNLGPVRRGVARAGSLSEYIRSHGPFRGALVDPDYMRDSVQVAATALSLAASGCPVVTRKALRRAWFYGSGLSALVRGPGPDPADDLAWLALAAHQKTIAWTDHVAELIWVLDNDRVRGMVAASPMPTTSILLATARPGFLPRALKAIARQERVHAEVLIGVHGGTREQVDEAEVLLREAGLSGLVINPPREAPLGVVLNLLGARSSGSVLVKWDDDDLYGPLHLRDLIAALRHSGSDIVGKAPEFTYFEQDDTTVLRNPHNAESESHVLAGGTLLMDRRAWERLGGFPPIPRAVDHYLKQAVLMEGMSCYRTHGFGFALVRHGHGHGHTWSLDERSYRSTAVRSWQGIPAVARLEA